VIGDKGSVKFSLKQGWIFYYSS